MSIEDLKDFTTVLFVLVDDLYKEYIPAKNEWLIVFHFLYANSKGHAFVKHLETIMQIMESVHPKKKPIMDTRYMHYVQKKAI